MTARERRDHHGDVHAGAGSSGADRAHGTDTVRPEHLGIEYDGARWQPLFAVGGVMFEPMQTSGPRDLNVVVNDVLVGSLEQRVLYCDRGHWMFKCYLPDLDGADSFPRYYMGLERAKDEITAWLMWRLWRMSNGATDPRSG